MDSRNFVVTCLNCKGHSRIRILNGKEVMYLDHTPIIACRLRPDLKWGFECQCGNDTRLAPEEVPEAKMLVAGASQSIVDRIIKLATPTPETKFKMESA